MAGSDRVVHPEEQEHLRSEARRLHERLRNVAFELLITEDLVADRYERMAHAGGVHADSYRLNAKRARAAADECRALALRLDELGPDGGAGS